MKPFKKNNKFNPRDNDRHDGKTFKRFDRSSPDKFRSNKFGNDSDRPRTFISKESRSGNGFKLHEAVCDKCGRKCDVPFEPTGNKPIYCRSCFRQNKLGEGHGNNFESKRFNDEQESNMPSASSKDLEQINQKLDKIMKALKIN